MKGSGSTSWLRGWLQDYQVLKRADEDLGTCADSCSFCHQWNNILQPLKKWKRKKNNKTCTFKGYSKRVPAGRNLWWYKNVMHNPGQPPLRKLTWKCNNWEFNGAGNPFQSSLIFVSAYQQCSGHCQLNSLYLWNVFSAVSQWFVILLMRLLGHGGISHSWASQPQILSPKTFSTCLGNVLKFKQAGKHDREEAKNTLSR